MSETPFVFPPSRKVLQRLFLLRNVEVLGQLTAVAVAAWGLSIPLPVPALLAVIAALALVNAFTAWRLRRDWPVTDAELFVHLLVDVTALTFLLYLSGGSTNPFVSLYLLPLFITATILSAGYTWAMAGLTLACYTLLLFFYLPLSHYDAESSVIGGLLHPGAVPAVPAAGSGAVCGTTMAGMAMGEGRHFGLHVLGMWFNFLVSASLIAYFVNRLAGSLRERDALLARAREEALRNEQVVALGTLAAGAAHELSTPLSSMLLIAGELQESAGERPGVSEDLRLLRQEIEHCKGILSGLTGAAGQGRACRVDDFLAGVLDQWQLMRPTVEPEVHWRGEEPVPFIVDDPTLRQSLINLFNNAADASPESVCIEGEWTLGGARGGTDSAGRGSGTLTIAIHDRGPGLTPELAAQAGKAIFTTKGTGLGIGLLLANATIERFGGEVWMVNREGGGASVKVSLPLERLSAGIADTAVPGADENRPGDGQGHSPG